MAQPVETATDDRHTHKDPGLIMVNVFKQESLDRQTNKQTDKQTDATKRIISPALRSIIMCANMVDSLSAGDVWQTFVIIASWSTKNRDLTWKFMYDR